MLAFLQEFWGIAPHVSRHGRLDRRGFQYVTHAVRVSIRLAATVSSMRQVVEAT